MKHEENGFSYISLQARNCSTRWKHCSIGFQLSSAFIAIAFLWHSKYARNALKDGFAVFVHFFLPSFTFWKKHKKLYEAPVNLKWVQLPIFYLYLSVHVISLVIPCHIEILRRNLLVLRLVSFAGHPRPPIQYNSTEHCSRFGERLNIE